MNRASTVNVRIQQLSKNYYYIFQYVFPRSVHVARYELKSNVHHSHTSWLLVIIQKKKSLWALQLMFLSLASPTTSTKWKIFFIATSLPVRSRVSFSQLRLRGCDDQSFVTRSDRVQVPCFTRPHIINSFHYVTLSLSNVQEQWCLRSTTKCSYFSLILFPWKY